jgi:hypothetical protein
MVKGLTGDENYNRQAEPYVRGMRRSHVGAADRLRSRAIYQELHIYTPRQRRQGSGLGRPTFRPLPPIELRLNNDQIEARRREVDNRIDAEMDALTRRSAQLDRMRTAGGVFLAARERFDDWPTSYKCLGIVTNGKIPNIPAKVTN